MNHYWTVPYHGVNSQGTPFQQETYGVISDTLENAVKKKDLM